MTQGGYQVIIFLLIKSKMAAANKKQCFFAISVLNCMTVFTFVILSPGFRNDYKFGISVIAHHFVIY